MNRKIIFLFAAVSITAVSFSQKADTTLIPYRLGNKWGFANAEKKIIIKPVYDDAEWFSQGFAVVKKGNRFGYINPAGKIVIPIQYTVAKPFRFGYVDDEKKQKSDTILFAGASLKADGYEICINTKGMRLAKCPAINENSDASSNTEIVGREKTYSLNSSSKLFDKIIDDYKITGDSNTYFIGRKDSMYGVFNNKFETVIPFVYTALSRFTSNNTTYLQAQKNSAASILKGNGTILVPAENHLLQNVQLPDKTHAFIVDENGKAGVKNTTGTYLIQPSYKEITYDENGGFVVTDNSGNKGFYFSDNLTVAPKYKTVKLAAKGSRYLMVTTAEDKKGYVGENGDEFFAN